jgi:hypothetical protein
MMGALAEVRPVVESLTPLVYSRRRKILISAFILFHVGCLAAWVMPRPSPIRSFLLGFKLPLPSHEKKEGDEKARWRVEPRPVIATYLWNTSQYQGWSMFAPTPVQTNRYVEAAVLYQDGNWRDYAFPRLGQMNFLEAWIEKRWRKIAQNMFDPEFRPYDLDVARWVAREMDRPDNHPVRVSLILYEAAVPRHDREELQGTNGPKWIDYPTLLRDKTKYAKKVVVDYAVRSEDLR